MGRVTSGKVVWWQVESWWCVRPSLILDFIRYRVGAQPPCCNSSVDKKRRGAAVVVEKFRDTHKITLCRRKENTAAPLREWGKTNIFLKSITRNCVESIHPPSESDTIKKKLRTWQKWEMNSRGTIQRLRGAALKNEGEDEDSPLWLYEVKVEAKTRNATSGSKHSTSESINWFYWLRNVLDSIGLHRRGVFWQWDCWMTVIAKEFQFRWMGVGAEKEEQKL